MEVLQDKDKKYLLDSIRNVADFPKPGIQFKDITTLLKDKEAFDFLMEHLARRYENQNIDFIVGIESRGFIFGAALATKLKKGFVPIRKPGKLPYTTISEKYSLEYGVDEVEIHIDAFKDINKAPRVLLVDDLIATGGTAKASAEIINKAGANCFEACFIIDLVEFGGSDAVRQLTSVYSVLEI